MKEFLYFSGEMPVSPFPKGRKEVSFLFPEVKLTPYDSFSVWVGTRIGASINSEWLPVTRIVRYNHKGTKHKCDSRCRSAKGGNCECSCLGKFHGIDK